AMPAAEPPAAAAASASEPSAEGDAARERADTPEATIIVDPSLAAEMADVKREAESPRPIRVVAVTAVGEPAGSDRPPGTSIIVDSSLSAEMADARRDAESPIPRPIVADPDVGEPAAGDRPHQEPSAVQPRRRAMR